MAHNRQSSEESNPKHENTGLFGISWAVFSPFSSSALASLPENTHRPARYTRQDDIPDPDQDVNGKKPTIRNYNAISSAPRQVCVPKKVATSLKVEAKVWFANERTWVSWLNLAVLLGTLALALFNASHEPVARRFAYVYAAISIGVVVYGFYLYQSRITMIRKRDPGHYDALVGPMVVSALLFFAVLANFVIRGVRQQKVPIPGLALLQQITSSYTLSV
ncbi:hypothetical protein PAXRUDRAFT_130940 [Paxillus rubicundulus Ve08.2h10]|uniref:DUF202 domain-containing protein n=1 Tax=Paxillus rubicundulus Ve08.2h10 TaxID=930991 RepID=A0A0D0DML0_9AGAM|nr:hypothetical protein PAXRUDRAFT_130940 [Paxillus rubicundulus Ve08.2h10]